MYILAASSFLDMHTGATSPRLPCWAGLVVWRLNTLHEQCTVCPVKLLKELLDSLQCCMMSSAHPAFYLLHEKPA
jgi:hypothetical protein